MKVKFCLFIALFLFTSVLSAQNALTEADKLATTAKVWGFLKYYHPEVASGEFDWDNELLKILPKVKKSETREELSLLYLNWINSLGEVKRCKSCQETSGKNYFDKNFDLSWIEDSRIFTKEVSRKLKYIENNRYTRRKPHYARSGRSGNIAITNEPEYKKGEYLDHVNYRYLSLFKYWNIIEYFFPYKYKTDENWNDVLVEMIPKFREASNEKAYHLVIQEIAAKINDSHTPIMRLKGIIEHLDGGVKSAPVRLGVLNDSVFVTGIYNDSLVQLDDLKVGDVIIEVENEPVQEIVRRFEKYIPSSNDKRINFFTKQLLLRNYKDSLEVSYLRKGEVHTSYVQLYLSKDIDYQAPAPVTEKYTILEDNIGYVNMGGIKIKEVDEMMEDLGETKAIIFDGRYHPKGIYRRISRHINSNRSEFVKIIVPDISYPGRFLWKKPTKYHSVGGNHRDHYKGKVILLVDGSTQSHGEYSTMALQTAPNAVTIGTQTSGADGNLSRFQFLGGFTTAISGNGIFYPDGTETQRVGVKVDIEVTPSLDGIRKGYDEILRKAIHQANTPGSLLNPI